MAHSTRPIQLDGEVSAVPNFKQNELRSNAINASSNIVFRAAVGGNNATNIDKLITDANVLSININRNSAVTSQT